MRQRINKGGYIKTFDGKLYKVRENTHAGAEYVHAEVSLDSKYDGKAIPMSQVYIVNIPEEQKDSNALLRCGVLMDTVNAQKSRLPRKSDQIARVRDGANSKRFT